MNDNVKEANLCYAKAEKALKTGMLKWTPDYEIAANEYQKAATFFRTAKMLDKCIEANVKAASCYENSRSFFSAAKCYEQAGLLSRDLNDWDKMISFFEKACLYFREHNVPDTAALTYNRGAGVLEKIKPEKSAEWYGNAYDVVLTEDRYLQAAEYANKAVRMYLKLKHYDNAVRWAEKAMESYLTGNETRSAGRQVCCIVLIQLAREDQVAAFKIYQANKGYVENDERYTLDNLFHGLDNYDNATIHQALGSPFIGSLDNEITKLVRDLMVKYEPKGGKAAEGGSGEADVEEDDEEAGAML